MGEEIGKGQQLDRGQSRDQQDDRQNTDGHCAARRSRGDPLTQKQAGQKQPGQQNRFRHSGQHLHGAGHGRGEQGFAAIAPGTLRQQDDPGQPAQSDLMVRPHQARQIQPVKRVNQAGQTRGETVLHPPIRQKIHAQSAEEEMRQVEQTQRPRQRQQQINQRWRI